MVSAVQDENAPARRGFRTPGVRGFSAPELAGFGEVQRLAYACAEAVAGQLRSGVTEREAARMQRVWLRERGVRDWFHLPFAWFGDRTAFAGFKVPLQFFPTDRKLEPGMPFILDMAPVYKGYTADVGYSGCLGLNPLHDRLLADLEAHRELILREARERRSLREIYEDVERLMTAQGYANRHRAYPFGVIAHKVDRVAERRWSPSVFGFGTQSLKGLVSDAVHGHRDGWSPLWSPYRFSDHPRGPVCGRSNPTSDSGVRARSSRRSWSSPTPRTPSRALSGWTTICRMCGAGPRRGWRRESAGSA